MNLQVDFSTPQTGVGYRFYDVDGVFVGARVTTGITPLAMIGPGVYLAVTSPPTNAVGIYWDCDNPLFTANEILSSGSGVTPPGPPDDVDVCRVYGYLVTPNNQPAAHVEITFTLVAVAPARTNRLIGGRAVTVKTDATGSLINRAGDLWIELQRNDVLVPSGTTYEVTSTALNMRSVSITLDAPTFDLASIVP